jgi:hypothetical protein
LLSLFLRQQSCFIAHFRTISKKNTLMSRNKKFSALLATLVVGFFSIYAAGSNFLSTNQTAQQVTITLNMQSGAQIPVALAPGQSTPTSIGTDKVIGLWLYGAYVPAGVNAVIPCPTGGLVDEMWVNGPNGSPAGAFTQPDTGTIS